MLETTFGPAEEYAIISLALDHPDFFTHAIPHLDYHLFALPETQYVLAKILQLYEEHEEIPTREILRDRVCRELTVDENYEEVLKIIDTRSQPRSVPFVKDTLLKWARSKSYGKIYSKEAMEAFQRGDFQLIDNIIESARTIVDTEFDIFYFFDQIQDIFKEDFTTHYSTGYKQLDEALSGGRGPSPGEVLLWMAATNVGKSIMLCNNAVNSVKSGLDTAFFSFEMSNKKLARRCLGALTEINMIDFIDKRNEITSIVGKTAESQANFALFAFPPGECSVEHIYAGLKHLKRKKGWVPKVICIDYLELMLSRRASYNDTDYSRQKHVASEIRGLAINSNSLVYSATQGNRSTAGATDIIDLDKIAESYGKTMSLDYIITLNQSTVEYEDGRIRFFIAKNREGGKKVTIHCNINYANMKVKEVD